MKVYLDNAATTPIAPEVIDAMLPILRDGFGNPSSTHAFGRQSKSFLELSRKKVAELLNVTPGEICFTSGGTEADNMAIRCSIDDLGITHAITSHIEHHAVLYCLEALEQQGKVKLSYVNLDSKGHVDLNHLEELLQNNPRTLVSLMHANNEIGTLLPLEKVGEICKKYDAVFHSDTVQTMAHYKMDLSKINIHFVTCSAHKFHGPKGIGFLYINGNLKINPMIHGGSQERNMRAGTENIYGIVGLAKAFEIAIEEVEEHREHVQGLKTFMMNELEKRIPGVAFNGDARGDSLYTVLSVCFPPTDKAEMLLFSLDIAGIAASSGSACSSGSNVGSHVLQGVKAPLDRPSIRFSFSRYTTREELEYCLEKLEELFVVEA